MKNTVMYVVFLVLVILCIYLYIDIKKTENILLRSGVATNAVIIETTWTRRGTWFKYQFDVNGIVFTASGGRTYKEIQVGDSILILYLAENPQINHTDYRLNY